MSKHDFGIIVGCYSRDYIFAKACCASIRYFVGEDVPICLLIDGSFPVDDLKKAYGVTSLYVSDFKDPFLRAKSTGWGLPKMALFWESPFERFLFLDADTVVWGNILTKVFKSDNWDMVICDHRTYEPKPGRTEEVFSSKEEQQNASAEHWFFSVSGVERHFPEFPWQQYLDRFYCTGVWAARRGTFPLEEYRHLLKLKEEDSGLFRYAEMGMLNFMIFRAFHEERLALDQFPIQTEADSVTWQEIGRRFAIGPDGKPIASDDDPWVIHFTYPKPLMHYKTYSGPMTHFRREAYYAITGQHNRALADLAIAREDLNYMGWKYHVNRILGRIQVAPVK